MAEKWLVIDSHIHYLPPEAIAKTGVSNGFDYSSLIKGELLYSYKRLQDIEGMLRAMEDAGVDMAVLAQSAWSAQGLEVSKALNDGYAGLTRRYPGKFILCGHVPLQGGQGVVDEIKRCINVLGYKGIALVSSMPDVTMDARELWPMYKTIDQLGVPIVVHPSVRFPIWGGGEKYELRRTISREYDIAKATVEVMYGVLKDFPNLKFIMPHYGGGMPAFKGRLRAYYEPEGLEIPAEVKGGLKPPRVVEELGISKAFDKVFDRLYFDMAGAGGGWLPMIEAALPSMRTDRLCFGTDYPFDMYKSGDIKSFIDNIKQLSIPERDKRLMLGGNVKNIFHI